MDTVDKKKRSEIMSKVGQENTGPEVLLRRALHRLGLRYKLHVKVMLGSPDIVFPRFKTVLFVHGCFWHRHGCKATTMPSSNVDFWSKKFNENVSRDKRIIESLIESGWRVIVVWGCSLEGKNADPKKVAEYVYDWLLTEEFFLTIPNSNWE